MHPDRMQLAKRRYSKVCARYLSGEANVDECERALAELERARRAALARPAKATLNRSAGSRR